VKRHECPDSKEDQGSYASQPSRKQCPTIHPHDEATSTEDRGLATCPIEMDVLARLDLAESRVTTHRAPDLFLELAGGDVVAEERVVCHPLAIITSHSNPAMSLTAHEPTRPSDIIRTMTDSAANAARVAPHHLGEVAPLVFIVRVVVRVYGLLLVPAVGGGARELDPSVVVLGRGANRAKVAAGALLCARQ
jgi:hypothetical protein